MLDRLIGLLGQKLLDALLPAVISTVQEAIHDWMPTMVKAVVVAVAQGAGQVVVDTTDKVTDLIPGDLDDRIVDSIVVNSLEWLKRL